MWFGRPPGPQWLRPFLAALTGYVVFAVMWAVLVRYFEPALAADHGGPALNLLSDIVEGLGFALAGLMFVFGLAFLGLGTVWGRFQLWLLRRMKADTWIVSAMTGVLGGWILSLAFTWLLADLSGGPRDHISPMIAGSAAGALAGCVLVMRRPGLPQRNRPPSR